MELRPVLIFEQMRYQFHPQMLCAIGGRNQYLARTGAGESGQPH
jgi:hypothetical protein